MKMKSAVPFIVLLLPIGGYIAYLLAFISSAPFWDDFDIHLSFINHWNHSPALNRLALLFERNGEHFVITNRLATLFDQALFHGLNFERLIWLGNLLYLTGICIWVFSCSRAVTACFLALSLMLSPFFPQSSLWASGALQHLSSFLWCALFMVLAVRRRFLPAAGFLALAAFSQANGALSALSLGTMLILCQVRSGGESRLTGAVWCVTSVLLIAVIAATQGHDSVHNYLPGPGHLHYAAVFIGAPLSSTADEAVWSGLILTALAALVFSRVSSRSLLPCAGMLWVILTALANSMARAGFGVDYAFSQSRYLAPGLFFLASLFLALYQEQNTRLSRGLALFFGALVLTAVWLSKSGTGLQEAQTLRTGLERSALRFQLFQTGASYPEAGQTHAQQIVNEAVSAGSFVWPAPQSAAYLSHPQPAGNVIQSERVVARNEWQLCNSDYLYMEGWAFHRREKSRPVILLSNPSGQFFILSRQPDPRLDVVRHHARPAELYSGISVLVSKRELPQDVEKAGMGVVTSDGTVKAGRLAEFSGQCR